jgi:hypothetical protein
MTNAEKARAAGLDEWTITMAYADFHSPELDAALILDSHRRVCIYALCHDNPTGNHIFPMFRGGVVRQPATPGEKAP